MKYFELAIACGWVITSLLVFGALLRGRMLQQVDGKPNTPIILLLVLAIAVGAFWSPIVVILLVRAMLRAKRPSEFPELDAKLAAADPAAALRKKYADNARAEVERLQREAKKGARR